MIINVSGTVDEVIALAELLKLGQKSKARKVAKGMVLHGESDYVASNESTPTASKPKSYHVITIKGKDNTERIFNALSANFDEQFYHRLTECDTTDAAYAITVKFASNYAYDVNFIKERLSEIRICASLWTFKRGG